MRIRRAETKPLLEAFKAWLIQQLEAESAKSALAKAIRYTLGHWEGLTVFLGDGRVEVDSNVVEREIRPIALGRKSWLFAGSDRGGERAAAMYSLIATALCRARHNAVYAARRTMPNGCGEARQLAGLRAAQPTSSHSHSA